MESGEIIEFEILGFNVRHRAEKGEDSQMAKEVADFVLSSINQIKDENPDLDEAKIAVLLALRLAKENFRLNRQYQENISKLHQSAVDALNSIESVQSIVS